MKRTLGLALGHAHEPSAIAVLDTTFVCECSHDRQWHVPEGCRFVECECLQWAEGAVKDHRVVQLHRYGQTRPVVIATDVAQVMAAMKAIVPDEKQIKTPLDLLKSMVIPQVRESEPVDDEPRLVVDVTAGGGPVLALLRQKELEPISVTLGSGSVPGAYPVSWRDVITNLQVMLQNGALKIAPKLALSDSFTTELGAAQVDEGDTFAWRKGQNDDLILAVGIAAWWVGQQEDSLLFL